MYIMRINRIVFGVSPSWFLLMRFPIVAAKLYETEQPKTVQALRESLYVDDFISSSDNVNEALSVTTTAKEILSHAGMDLCKWMTNSSELRAKWIESGLEYTAETDKDRNVLKVLGLVWRPETDDFVFDLKGLLEMLKGKENTEKCAAKISWYFQSHRFPNSLHHKSKVFVSRIMGKRNQLG